MMMALCPPTHRKPCFMPEARGSHWNILVREMTGLEQFEESPRQQCSGWIGGSKTGSVRPTGKLVVIKPTVFLIFLSSTSCSQELIFSLESKGGLTLQQPWHRGLNYRVEGLVGERRGGPDADWGREDIKSI